MAGLQSLLAQTNVTPPPPPLACSQSDWKSRPHGNRKQETACLLVTPLLSHVAVETTVW